jgi:hypothetical protein
MKIKYLSGPKAGQTTHAPVNQNTQLLIDAGLIEVIPMAKRGTPEWLRDMKERSEALNPSVGATVQWSVAQGAVNSRYFISGKCSQPNCSTFNFDGAPDGFVVRQGTTDWNVGAKRHLALEDITFIHSCGCGQPEKVPASVAAQYRKLFKLATTLGKDESAYFHDARPQVSKPVDPSTWQYPLTGPLREGNEKDALQNFLPDPGDNQPLDPKFYKWK